MKFTPFPYFLQYPDGTYLDISISSHNFIKSSVLPLLRFRHTFEAQVFITQYKFTDLEIVKI